MADRAVIDQLLTEAATLTSKNASPSDLKIRGDQWAQAFKGTTTDVVSDAFDHWVDSVSSERPPMVLPTAADIWRHIRAHRPPNEPTARTVRPRPHVVRANQAIGELVRSMGIGPRALDTTARGPAATMTEAQRAAVWAALADLPETVEPSATSPCRGCDGTGWVDPETSRAALYGPAEQAHDRAVYPCRECNDTEFFSEPWDGYFRRSRTETENRS